MSLIDAATSIRVAVPIGFTTWQLDGATTAAGPWSAVNAGLASSPFRARFGASDNYWRLLVVRDGAVEVAGTGRVPR